MNRVSRIAATSVVAVSMLALSGCTKTVSGDDVADQISSAVQKQAGTKPDKVTCPDLTGEKGKSVTCKVTVAGQKLDAKVTVTSVDGNTVKFNVTSVKPSS